MTKNERDKIRILIEEQVEELKKDIKAFEKLTQPISPDSAIGRLTRMEAINSKSINDAALNKARNRMAALQSAFRRINDPEFGECDICEEAIPLKRLMLMPESRMCVKCAEKQS